MEKETHQNLMGFLGSWPSQKPGQGYRLAPLTLPMATRAALQPGRRVSWDGIEQKVISDP